MQEGSFLLAEIWNVARTEKGTAVLIRPVDSDRAVPIFIGPLEAHAILIGMSEVHMPRPLTHDMVASLCEKLHVQIERIEITDLKEGTFFACIILKHGIKKIILDSRPSDALGMATRVKCPIYIARSIVESASIPVNFIEENGEESMDLENRIIEPFVVDLESSPTEISNEVADEENEKPVPQKDILETPRDIQKSVLKMKLDQAVMEENYEEAARIRDIMNNL